MRKGFTFDLAVLMAIMVFMAMFGVIVYLALTSMVTASAGTSVGPTFNSVLTPLANGLKNSIDSAMVLILIFYTLVMVAISAVMFTSPIMFFVGFIVLCMLVVLSMIISNMYVQFASAGAISASASAFVFTPLIMANLPYIVIVIFIISAIYFYSKESETGYYYG